MDDFPEGIPQRRLFLLSCWRGDELVLQFSVLFAAKKNLLLFLLVIQKKGLLYFFKSSTTKCSICGVRGKKL
jgi:hypothetical protein